MLAYPFEAVRLAEERGWDFDAHRAAIEAGDDNAISLTHPINWLTEEEAEEYFA